MVGETVLIKMGAARCAPLCVNQITGENYRIYLALSTRLEVNSPASDRSRALTMEEVGVQNNHSLRVSKRQKPQKSVSNLNVVKIP